MGAAAAVRALLLGGGLAVASAVSTRPPPSDIVPKSHDHFSVHMKIHMTPLTEQGKQMAQPDSDVLAHFDFGEKQIRFESGDYLNIMLPTAHFMRGMDSLMPSSGGGAKDPAMERANKVGVCVTQDVTQEIGHMRDMWTRPSNIYAGTRPCDEGSTRMCHVWDSDLDPAIKAQSGPLGHTKDEFYETADTRIPHKKVVTTKDLVSVTLFTGFIPAKPPKTMFKVPDGVQCLTLEAFQQQQQHHQQIQQQQQQQQQQHGYPGGQQMGTDQQAAMDAQRKHYEEAMKAAAAAAGGHGNGAANHANPGHPMPAPGPHATRNPAQDPRAKPIPPHQFGGGGLGPGANHPAAAAGAGAAGHPAGHPAGNPYGIPEHAPAWQTHGAMPGLEGYGQMPGMPPPHPGAQVPGGMPHGGGPYGAMPHHGGMPQGHGYPNAPGGYPNHAPGMQHHQDPAAAAAALMRQHGLHDFEDDEHHDDDDDDDHHDDDHDDDDDHPDDDDHHDEDEDDDEEDAGSGRVHREIDLDAHDDERGTSRRRRKSKSRSGSRSNSKSKSRANSRSRSRSGKGKDSRGRKGKKPAYGAEDLPELEDIEDDDLYKYLHDEL